MKAIWVGVTMLAMGPAAALAQPAAPQGAACKPAAQSTPGPIPAPSAAEMAPVPARPLPSATAIPGVVAAGSTWRKVWQGGGNSADGVLRYRGDSVIIAQEDFDSVREVAPDGRSSVVVAGAKGVGSLSMDRQGRLYGAHRTERPGSTKPDAAQIANAITQLAPERRTIADRWTDGTPLTVRPNDLAADGRGGAFFTSGCLYYADAAGARVVADNLRTNGIVFSPDDKILYVTNGPGVVAFEVVAPGQVANRRDFATISGSGSGDGLAVDTEGRVYVTVLGAAEPGVQVFDRTGRRLGLIPTPRPVISVAFAGPDRGTLYVVGGGAEDEAGRPIRQGPQYTAATLYALPMLSRGLPDRAK